MYRANVDAINAENNNTASDVETVDDSNDSDFYNQIKKWDKKTVGFSFVLGKTSNALREAGIPDKQIRMDASGNPINVRYFDKKES